MENNPNCSPAMIRERLRRLASPKRAKDLQWFFKTGPGEYGEGDTFMGICVPDLRRLARECRRTTLSTALLLLRSKLHEERLLALMLLVDSYARADQDGKRRIYTAYLRNTRHINNWDLVDLSCRHIVGAWLSDKNHGLLYRLARSKSLWERRIAIVSTSYFIGHNDFADTLQIAEMLMKDREDLIHKAAGWMLREVGKRDVRVLRKFLDKHCRRMPRTMLRYAIEKLPGSQRAHYMHPGS